METIFDLPSIEMNAVSFLQNLEVLPNKQLSKNDHDIKLYVTNNKAIWRCSVK